MRFKKLIAAGASFLLVVGASTLGAAAAYADDAPVTDPVVTETTPEPAPEPDPAPAPEPVVETVPEPVVEPEPAPEPVVEPTTDPVESAPPSTESDSDPPADTSSDFTSSSSDSGDAPITTSAPTTTGFTRTTSSLKTGFAAGNHKDDDTPQTCLDLTDGLGYEAKVDTVGDPATVSYTAPAGFLVAAYCVKAGSAASGGGPMIIDVIPDAASIVIDHPDVNSVSHYQVLLIATTPTPVTPAAQGSDETCLRETILVGGTIQLTLITGVTYTITGPGGNVPFDGTGLASGLAAGDYDVSFVLASGYTTSVVSPIEITIGAFTGDCSEDIVVTPAAQGSDETCDEVEDVVVGGSIQLTLLTGVTYTITGPGAVNVPFDGSGLASDLPAGDYDVTWVLDPGYTTSVVSPIEITIGEPDGECGEVDDECEESSTASLGAFSVPADDECPEDDKVKLCHATQGANPFTAIEISVQAAFNGHVDPPANQDDHLTDIIPPFDYKVQGVLTHFGGLNWPYGDPPTAEELVEWLAFWEAGCVEEDEVTPGAQKVDQTCENLLPVEGNIQVTVIPGVTYTVTGPNGVVPLDGSGNTGPIEPGNYSVAFVLDPGLTTSVVSPILLTINPFDGDCELIEFPLVTPAVTSSALSCLDLGSYTLSNDLNDPNAVEWTVNGNPLGLPLASPSQFSVTSPGVYNIHAEPNDPDYGFPGPAQTDWTLTFVDAEDCDLATLALTGQSPNAFIGGAMVLILTGLAMFRLRTARREKMSLI